MSARLGTMTQDELRALTPWLLRGRRQWRSDLRELEPRTSSSVVPFGVTGGLSGSRIEAASIARACVSVVLDNLDRSLARLPALARRAATLHYDDGLSVARTARRLGLTVGTARSILDRIKARVAAGLCALPHWEAALRDFHKVAQILRRVERHWLRPEELTAIEASSRAGEGWDE